MNMKAVYNETLGELSSESSKYLFINIAMSISVISVFFFLAFSKSCHYRLDIILFQRNSRTTALFKFER